ncbi:complement receptor type 1-like isoform X1 [Amphiprion ocellaris]|uniref:Sushi domain-containing protein n=1 Tax=Amphiprion ocellaris TaxID=80972 RepID=A0A3Q1BUG1_AMPOC|nr:complement receptor type 1-like isoform X1 [Amphiprion ocellaris]XP_054869248.1 complement receptor type 1-like isoform X1 [Amphiprion ocellaris]
MRTIGWNILTFAFALTSAQGPKECSSPLEYPNIRLSSRYSSRNKFSSGDKVYYNCAEDYTPSTGSRAVECKGGTWTRLTLKCDKKSCGYAGDLLHGQLHYEGNSYLGEKVYATCNEGYTLKGQNYMICQASGWTGEFPTCEEGETTCSTPAVTNSVHRAGGVSEYQVGETMSFACQQGFRLDGAQQITCGSDGQWQPQPPKCLPSPDKTQPAETGACGVPQNVQNSNANLADKYITMTSFPSSAKVYYVCDVGYTPVGGSRVRICKNGKWTPLRLNCERKPCGSAGEIVNGRFVYSGVEFGDTATAVCDEGYILVGEVRRNCMSNGWDGRIPVCEAVDCDDPPVVKNAEMKGPQEPPYNYRTVISYQCRVGTLIGQKEIWCTKNGTWSTPPECHEITCPPPNVTNAFWMRAQNQFFRHQDTILIECRRGFMMKGPNSITCNNEGQWIPRLPECRRRPRRQPYRRG